MVRYCNIFFFYKYLNYFVMMFTNLTFNLLLIRNSKSHLISVLWDITYYETLYYSFFYSNFSKILVPLQSAMTVTLPNTPGSHPDHNPFPSNEIYIEGLEDMVCILYE